MPNHFVNRATDALSAARASADKLRTLDADNKHLTDAESDEALMNAVMDLGTAVVEAVAYGLLAIAEAVAQAPGAMS